METQTLTFVDPPAARGASLYLFFLFLTSSPPLLVFLTFNSFCSSSSSGCLPSFFVSALFLCVVFSLFFFFFFSSSLSPFVVFFSFSLGYQAIFPAPSPFLSSSSSSSCRGRAPIREMITLRHCVICSSTHSISAVENIKPVLFPICHTLIFCCPRPTLFSSSR